MEQLSRIRIQKFEAEMELTDGPCVGRYIVISNESDRDMDAEAVFRFYDKEGAYIDDNTSHAYGISAGGRGIVFGQIDNKNVDHITSHISFSESIYRPIDQCNSCPKDDSNRYTIRRAWPGSWNQLLTTPADPSPFYQRSRPGMHHR